MVSLRMDTPQGACTLHRTQGSLLCAFLVVLSLLAFLLLALFPWQLILYRQQVTVVTYKPDHITCWCTLSTPTFAGQLWGSYLTAYLPIHGDPHCLCLMRSLPVGNVLHVPPRREDQEDL